MGVRDLPMLNAVLNGTAFCLLICALVAIRRKRTEAHRRFILGAIGVSAAFLTSYLVYHFQHGSTPFPADGTPRTIYFLILIPHTILAVALVPLVAFTLRFAMLQDFEKHRRLARFTMPIWLYVSVTGVLIYMMLYQWYGPAGA